MKLAPSVSAGRRNGFAASTAKQQLLRQLICSDAPEQALRYRGACLIAGVDEVGRGSLFGPVVAAAVILPERMAGLARAGLRDSKQLTREMRETLDRRIRRVALAIHIAEIDAETIDRVNIYQATRLAMLAAVEGLGIAPDHLLIDAMRVDHPCPQTKLIYGDSLSLSIAAASVIAKVHRDALMRKLDAVHPEYGLASHKGYGTPEHRRALAEFGPCPMHRMTFAPVRAACGRDRESALERQLDSGELIFDDGELEDGATWV
jgi:ribonuclease HII